MAPQYSYSIGSSAETLTNIESLVPAVTAPKSSYQPYSDQVDLTSGGVRGVGLPVAKWKWSVLGQAERDKLRTFCSGASAAVWIRTRTNESSDTYGYFTAIMIWPNLTEEKDTGRRMDFEIEFRQLVSYTPPT